VPSASANAFETGQNSAKQQIVIANRLNNDRVGVIELSKAASPQVPCLTAHLSLI
jgi:hypothetical protein